MEKVKVLYNTLVTYQRSKSTSNEGRITPFFEVDKLLLRIKNRAKLNRFFELEGRKFMFIETLIIQKNESDTLITGMFKSARYQFRPKLINKINGSERDNPKLISEGDIIKTHFTILISKSHNEVFHLLEYNYFGITMKNFIDYLSHFNKKIFKDEAKNNNLIFQYNIIPKDDFIESLRSIKSVKLAEVTIDKQFLGDSALNFSNRLVSVKNELKLTIGSNPRESIKEFTVDLFNKYNVGHSGISKIRIKGRDESNNDILLDTSFMNKMEYLNIDKDLLTGELNSLQILDGLTRLITNL
jgi:hypothetical protein